MRSVLHLVRRVTVRLFGEETSTRLIVPILSDIDIERRTALDTGQQWRARWIVLLGCASLVHALALHGFRTIVEGAGLFVLLFAILTIALALPPLRGVGVGLILYVLPQAAPLSIPLAIAFAIAWQYRHGSRFASTRRVLAVGVIGSGLALATMQWLVPDANQAFRVAAAHRIAPALTSIPRGVHELSLSEMARLLRQPSSPFNARLLERQLHLQVALGFSSGLLALLAVALARGRRPEHFPAPTFTAMVIIYSLAVIWSSRGSSSTPLLVWLPHAAIGALSCVLLHQRTVDA